MRHVILILLALLGRLPAADVPLADPSELRIQVTHPETGALGRPFPLAIAMSVTGSRDFHCEGKVVDADGKLVLSGKWDLVLDRIEGRRVVSSVSLKPAGGAAVLASLVTGGNLACTWERPGNGSPRLGTTGSTSPTATCPTTGRNSASTPRSIRRRGSPSQLRPKSSGPCSASRSSSPCR